MKKKKTKEIPEISQLKAELNREIPPSLYNAVAEVLVFIFRLDSQKNIVK